MARYCSACGTKIRSDGTFCEGCGRKLISEEILRKQMEYKWREELKEEVRKEFEEEEHKNKEYEKLNTNDKVGKVSYFEGSLNVKDTMYIALYSVCIGFLFLLLTFLADFKGFPIEWLIKYTNSSIIDINWLNLVIDLIFYNLVFFCVFYIISLVLQNRRKIKQNKK
jgi:hypothetical protein